MIRAGIQHKRTEPEGQGLLNSFFGRILDTNIPSLSSIFPTLIKLENEPLLTPNDIRTWNVCTKITYITIGLMVIVFCTTKVFDL